MTEGGDSALAGSCAEHGEWTVMSVAGAEWFLPPQVACEKTVSAMHHVLQRTIKCAKGTTGWPVGHLCIPESLLHLRPGVERWEGKRQLLLCCEWGPRGSCCPPGLGL